jgi:hypothetical protein
LAGELALGADGMEIMLTLQTRVGA